MKLAVLRVGPVDVGIVQNIQKRLCTTFPETACTIVNNVMPIPEEAYNQRRHQYNSTKILMRIWDHVQGLDVNRVLGVVEADLYASRLNFVFGEAECPGKVAVISFYRLRPEFYGHFTDEKLFVERCAKEAVHEVGHTLGLSHCRDSSCVMFFSNSISDTDHKASSFCDRCFRLISMRLKRF
jgi:archaemetzincin